ncbi:MFS transporter [Ureaplasma ceti]|uniref:Major facilitator superfamily (MFS) profile domain-containing protein n=1 Tax=Ureaplasma ceti TaxID=3119530 RepID=A0ABP9U5G3_9BACT
MNKLHLKSNASKNYDIAKYVVLFACCLINIISYSIPQYGTPLTLWSLSRFVTNNSMFLIGMMFLVASIINMLVSPYVNKIFRYINIKVFFSLGIVINGFGFMCFGLAQFATHALGAGITTIYIAQTLVTIGAMIFSTLGIPLVIHQWFSEKQKGLAIGIATSGTGVGAMTWQAIINPALKSPALGYVPNTAHLAVWNVFFIFGAISIAVGLIITLTMIRLPKTDAYRNTTDQRNFVRDQKQKEDMGPGYQVLKRNPWFWWFVIGFFITSLGVGTWANMHFAFLEDGLGWAYNKYKYQLMGYIGFFFAIGSIIGNSIGGTLFDKFKSAKIWVVGSTMRILGLFLLLLSAKATYAIFGASFFSGLGTLTYRTGRSFIVMDLFKKRDVSKILSVVAVAYSLGYCISLPTLNGIADSGEVSYIFGIKCHHQWTGAWIFAIGALGLGAILTWIAIKKISHLKTEGLQTTTFNKFNWFMWQDKLQYQFMIWQFWYFESNLDALQKKYQQKLQKRYTKLLLTQTDNLSKCYQQTVQQYQKLLKVCQAKQSSLQHRQTKRLSKYQLSQIKFKHSEFLQNLTYQLETTRYNYEQFNQYYRDYLYFSQMQLLQQLTLVYDHHVTQKRLTSKYQTKRYKKQAGHKIEQYYNKYRAIHNTIMNWH